MNEKEKHIAGTELTVNGILEIREAQLAVIDKLMREDIHYGKIPGASKPSLWQPGAQLLDNLHGYAPLFDLIDKVEDWVQGFFQYRYKCRLIQRRDNIIVGEGIGSCNSKEKKYRIAVYHGEDEGMPVDPRDNVNTYEKMAQKRAHVMATLNATGLSDIFTQDVEDAIGQFAERQEGKLKTKSETHWCEEHNVAFTKHSDKQGQVWWSHRLSDGSYCNEGKTKKKPVETSGDKAAKRQPPTPSPIKGEGKVEAPPSPKKEDFPKPEAIKNIGDLRTAWHKFFKEPWEEALAIIGVESQSQIADAGEAWRRILEAKVPKQGEREEAKTKKEAE